MTSVAVFALFAGQLDLLGKSVEVDQDKAGQLVGLRSLLLVNSIHFVNRFVSDGAKLMRPISQRLRELAGFSELLYAMKKAQTHVFRRHLLGRDFQRAAIHGASCVPVSSLDSLFRLQECATHTIRYVIWAGGRRLRRKKPKVPEFIWIFEIPALLTKRVMWVGVVQLGREGAETNIASKVGMPVVYLSWYLSLSRQCEPGVLGAAMRAVVAERNHE